MASHPAIFSTNNFAQERAHESSHGSTSWWCDGCLEQCFSLDEQQMQAEEHWTDFFRWWADIILKCIASVLAALCCILGVFMGGVTSEEDGICRLEQEYKWLTVKRQRLLCGIDQVKSDMGRACFDGLYPDVYDLERSLANLQAELDATTAKLESVEAALGC